MVESTISTKTYEWECVPFTQISIHFPWFLAYPRKIVQMNACVCIPLKNKWSHVICNTLYLITFSEYLLEFISDQHRRTYFLYFFLWLDNIPLCC